MDGNGRWAKKRGQPRAFGHYMGGRNLFSVARAAKDLGIETLTVYAFSTENWKRPKEEIDYLMQTPVDFYYENKAKMDQIDYQIKFIGRRDRIPKQLLEVIEEIEVTTSKHPEFQLIIALDYGSYHELIDAMNHAEKPYTEKSITNHLMLQKPVDLLIRTSGEKRLSNFLLWQVSYAELYFTKVHWPSFSKKQLMKAVKDYKKRNRRYGGLK